MMNVFLKNHIQILKLIIIGIVLVMPLKINAQQDTIYYNNNWKETVKDSAAFFRPPVKPEGDLFRFKDYYISGQLQMSGLSKTRDKSTWHGKVSWYTEDGKLYQQGNYTNYRLNGPFITFLNNKKLIANYDNGYFVSGAKNVKQGRNRSYSEIKNDTVIDIIFDKDINGIRYENYRAVNGGRSYSKYYDENGNLIATLEVLENGYLKGAEVFYYYEPMRVMQINYYPYEKLLGNSYYYPNGQIRTKFELKPKFKKTYYLQDGTELGSVTYNLENDYLKPETGSEYLFAYNFKDTDASNITSIKTYENGNLQREEIRYDEGKLKTVTTYKDNFKTLQISYDDTGNELARITYENYYPLTGTEVSANKRTTYNNGELVKEINYYPKTKMVFSEKTTEKETYFNKDGKVIGNLEIEYENKYAKPLNGKRFTVGYDSEISRSETYKDGFLTERTVFRGKLIAEDNMVDFKRTEYYEDNGFKKIREVVFYSNGAKQSDIDYKGYEKTAGKFYNEKDELIGTYDYINKDGKLYEFFSESDAIRLIQEDENGNLVKLKRFDYGPYRKYGDVNAVLVEEIDASCCSKSYKKTGEVLAEATYKNELPWQGTVYDAVKRSKYTIENGKRNGLFTTLDYNQETILEEGQYIDDKKEGIFKSYNYRGQLQVSVTYKNDVLNGEAIYYDNDGKETSRLIYKNGNPFEGTKIITSGYNKNPTEETYANGFITQRISYDANGKRISRFEEGKETQTIAYHKDTDKKRLSYTVDDYYVNGEIIRYDKNGKEQHKALFQNNKLVSGVVYITSRDTYDKRIAYIILNRQEKKLSVTMKGYNDEVLFFAEESLESGYTDKYIKKLNLYIDNIKPESLY